MNFSHNVRYQPLDAINLVFNGLNDAKQLLATVLTALDGAGWQQDVQDHEYLIEGDSSLRAERAWRTLGPVWKRYHVRFWHGKGEILASAHRERVKLWPPGHDVLSFNDGKRKMEDVFTLLGWNVHSDGRDLRPTVTRIDKPDLDGLASVITHP